MRKKYIQPEMGVVHVHVERMLTISGVTSSSNGINIGYGGVDVDGSLDADVKENSFEFEWE